MIIFDKIVPPYLSFHGALVGGMIGRIENAAYLAYVRTLPCCTLGCWESVAGHAHHIYDVDGLSKGGATKQPDYFVIPLCETHHGALHHDVARWEAGNGSQLLHVSLTLLRAIGEGVLRT